MRIISLWLLFFSLAVCGWSFPAAAMAATVEFFAPQGTVKNVRQVSARFDQAMARFGDMRLEAPFASDCPFKGTGRWVDGLNWVFDFEQDLPAGVARTFTLKPGLKSLAGVALSGQNQFSIIITNSAVFLNGLPLFRRRVI